MTVLTDLYEVGALKTMFVSKKNDYGILTGWAGLTDEDTLTTSEMRRCKTANTAPNPSSPPQYNRRVYDGGFGPTFTSPNSSVPTADLLMGAIDVQLEIAAARATTYDWGQWRISMSGEAAPDLEDLMVLTHSEAVSLVTGVRGYMNKVYGSVQLFSQDYESQSQTTTANYRYSMALGLMFKWITGEELTDKFDLEDGTSIKFFSRLPVMYGMSIGGGVDDDTITTQFPIGDPDSVKVIHITITDGVVAVEDATITSDTIEVGDTTIPLDDDKVEGDLYLFAYECQKLVAASA